MEGTGNTNAGSSLGDTIRFHVTPDILRNKSVDLSRSIRRMGEHFGELQRLVEGTGAYWMGEAGDMHRQRYRDLKENVEGILGRLEEYPRDLLTIARNYMDVELSIEEDVETLPEDVIL